MTFERVFGSLHGQMMFGHVLGRLHGQMTFGRVELHVKSLGGSGVFYYIDTLNFDTKLRINIP